MSEIKKIKINDNFIANSLDKGLSLNFEGYDRGVALTPLSYTIKYNKEDLFNRVIKTEVPVNVSDLIYSIESLNTSYLKELLKRDINHKEKIEKKNNSLSILEYVLSFSRYHHEDKKVLFSNLKTYINYLEKNNYQMEDVLGKESIFNSSWKQYYHIKFLLNHLPKNWIKEHLNKEYVVSKNVSADSTQSTNYSISEALIKINAPIIFNLLLMCNSHVGLINKLISFIDINKKDNEGNTLFHYLTLHNHPAWSELHIKSSVQIKNWIIQLLENNCSPFEENNKGQSPYSVLKNDENFKESIIEYQKRKLEKDLDIVPLSQNIKRLKI